MSDDRKPIDVDVEEVEALWALDAAVRACFGRRPAAERWYALQAIADALARLDEVRGKKEGS